MLNTFIWSLVFFVVSTWRGLVDYREDRDCDDLFKYIDKEFHRYISFVFTVIIGLILLIWWTYLLLNLLW